MRRETEDVRRETGDVRLEMGDVRRETLDFGSDTNESPSSHLSPFTSHISPLTSCIQVQGRYIVTPLASGLAVIDQQRAHERIIYNRLQTSDLRVQNSQTLLYPVSCHFSAADAELLSELLPDLKGYGFEISAAGQCTFVITATPADLDDNDLQALIDQMLSDYKGAAMQKFGDRGGALSASLARQMAVRAGTTLSEEQMQHLIADLFACPMAEVSPSGKKIITIVKPEELLK